MSLATAYAVMCDRCGHWPTQRGSAREARAAAKQAGFVRIPGAQHRGKFNGGRDLCKRCAALEPATDPTGSPNA